MITNSNWKTEVLHEMKLFAKRYSRTYKISARSNAAYFEIGCFLSLIIFYESLGYTIKLENLVNGKYKYKSSPSGIQNNFSHVHIIYKKKHFRIHQNLRVLSHLGDDITFTPDILVITNNNRIEVVQDEDYFSGKRGFCFVKSKHVKAAHECKSLYPFPELLISFLGMFIAAHKGSRKKVKTSKKCEMMHLAPTLFVGGLSSKIHEKMLNSLKKAFPINIVTGLHSGDWKLNRKDADLTMIT